MKPEIRITPEGIELSISDKDRWGYTCCPMTWNEAMQFIADLRRVVPDFVNNSEGTTAAFDFEKKPQPKE